MPDYHDCSEYQSNCGKCGTPYCYACARSALCPVKILHRNLFTS